MMDDTITTLLRGVADGSISVDDARTALEGAELTEEQKANSLQMVMLYQAKVERSNEHMTIGENGEMVHKSKSELRNELRQAGQTPIAQVKLKD